MDKNKFLTDGFGDYRQVLGRLSELVIQTSAHNGLLKSIAHRRTTVKTDGSLVTEVDQAMERRIRAELESKWPGTGFLGEEGGGGEHLWAGDRPFWCLGPSGVWTPWMARPIFPEVCRFMRFPWP